MFEAQLLAAKAENPALPIEELAEKFFAAYGGESRESWLVAAQNFANNWEKDGLMEDGALSERGFAFACLSWSSATCRKLLGALETLPPLKVDSVRSAAKLNAHLWRAMRDMPEAGAEISRFFSPRSRLVATPNDLEKLAALWLKGLAPEAIFAAMPRAKDLEGIEQWLENEEREPDEKIVNPTWSGEFDRFLDFLRAGWEIWTPALWRAAALLAPLAGNVAEKIDWNIYAAQFEVGVDSDWAVRAHKFNAPGGRPAIAAIGRVWPFETREVTLDPLVLAPLGEKHRQQENLLIAHRAVDEALQLTGGPYCYAGRNVLMLRDWLWARAGLSK